MPKELQDAAEIDGAGKWRVLWQVYMPVSLPAIATITLFSGVFHWNSWFDGLIYANHPRRYPVQTYLQILLRGDILSQATSLSEISEIYHLHRAVGLHRDWHRADPGAVPVPAALIHQGYRDRQRQGMSPFVVLRYEAERIAAGVSARVIDRYPADTVLLGAMGAMGAIDQLGVEAEYTAAAAVVLDGGA